MTGTGKHLICHISCRAKCCMVFVMCCVFKVVSSSLCVMVVYFAELRVACCMLGPGRNKADWSLHLMEDRWGTRTVLLPSTELLCLLDMFSFDTLHMSIFVFLSFPVQPSPLRHGQRDVVFMRVTAFASFFSSSFSTFPYSFPFSKPFLSCPVTHWQFTRRRPSMGNNSAATGALADALREVDKRRKKMRTTSDWWVWGVGSREKGGIRR